MKTNIPSVEGAKHYVHDLSHDINTTSDFGFLQPILCREIPEKGSKITIRPAQLVRLMPMVLPTFGRLTLNTYNVFVPIESVYHPWGSLRAQQTYQGANAQYIPDMVISANLALHSLVLKCLSNVRVLKVVPELSSGSILKFPKTSFTVLPINSTGNTELDEVYQQWESDVSLKVWDTTNILNSHWLQYRGTIWDSDENLKNLKRYDWIDVVTTQGGTYLMCGEYHIAAKNIRKILIGCGYKVLWDQELLSFLPLLAYYKAWFDLFHPQRDITWKDTNAAALQEYCEQYGLFNLCSHEPNTIIMARRNQLFDFYLDLAQCYYTQSPDFVSAHITGQATDTVVDSKRPFLNSLNEERFLIGGVDNEGVPILPNPQSSGTSSRIAELEHLNINAINLLRQMQIRNNAKSLLGGDVAKFMKEILGTGYKEEDDSYWIGSSKLDINISPVFSNAETEEGWLGQFAGQGSGGSQGTKYTYVNKYSGFVISLMTVVPESRFCQGVDMNLKHVKNVDFYDRAFDSYTLLPTPKKYIFAEQTLDNLQNPQDFSESFGNVPNYIEYCVAQNIQNGDMSLPSTRETYLPFTLDKLLPYTDVVEDDAGNIIVENTPIEYIVNSTIWRYIGLYQWIGNYGRIFKNSGTVTPSNAILTREYNNIFYSKGFDDNIVIDCYLEFKVSWMKLPCSDSFMLMPFEGNSASIEMS